MLPPAARRGLRRPAPPLPPPPPAAPAAAAGLGEPGRGLVRTPSAAAVPPHAWSPGPAALPAACAPLRAAPPRDRQRSRRSRPRAARPRGCAAGGPARQPRRGGKAGGRGRGPPRAPPARPRRPPPPPPPFIARGPCAGGPAGPRLAALARRGGGCGATAASRQARSCPSIGAAISAGTR